MTFVTVDSFLFGLLFECQCSVYLVEIYNLLYCDRTKQREFYSWANMQAYFCVQSDSHDTLT